MFEQWFGKRETVPSASAADRQDAGSTALNGDRGEVPAGKPMGEKPFEQGNKPQAGIAKGAVLPGITFKENKATGEWVSSAPGRKAIVASGFTPVAGQKYTVRVLEDSMPADAAKGKFTAAVEKTAGVAGKVLTTEEWKSEEGRLNAFERKVRKGSRAKLDLEDDSLPARAVAEAKRRAKEGDTANEQTAREGSPLSALTGLREEAVDEALSKMRALDAREATLRAEEEKLMSAKRRGGSATQALREVIAELAVVRGEREDLLASSPEAFVALHLLELREYRRALLDGKLAETPYVQEVAKDLEMHLRAGQPVFVYGHLGSGKTELSLNVAERLSKSGGLIISGAKDIALSELYGHQILDISKIDMDELAAFNGEIETAFNKWQKENPKQAPDEIQRAHERILATHIAARQGGTISSFFLGPVYRAMQEGRPVILDEVNAIPHDVLISLNHVLTRKPGDKVLVQQNSGSEITVKEGFGFILTGNLNDGGGSYIGRQDMDPAFLSRLYKVNYDYLPQKTDGSMDAGAADSELFHLILASMMNRNGDIEAPKGAVQKLWNLAKAARVTQDVFSGKQVDKKFYYQEGGQRQTAYKLREGVLSNRALSKILRQWQGEGFRHELDHYLWKEFISQSTVASDRAYLYQLFKDRFGFFQGAGWEQNPNYGTSGSVGSFNLESPELPSEDLEFSSARDVVKFAFGAAPERSQWPVKK